MSHTHCKMYANQTPAQKLVLLGETHVGKSCLITRFAKGHFPTMQQSTIGAAFLASSIKVDQDTTVKFEIWDTAGSERYHSLAPMYYRNARAAIVVYDLSNFDSFERAKIWVNELKDQASKEIIIVLAGNKLDLCEDTQDNDVRIDNQRQVSYEEGLSYSVDNNLIFLECSAKTGYNIQEIFLEIGKAIPKGNDPFALNTAYMRANTVRVGEESSQSVSREADEKSCCKF